MDQRVVTYRFQAKNDIQAEFELRLDPESLLLEAPEADGLPEWTELSFQKCPNCTLSQADHPHCPAAAHLPRLVHSFNRLVSHDKVRVSVETPERSYSREVSTQVGIGTLMGLLMATSGCPMTTLFRPMARFHLPFSTQEETIYRAASAYLLADYFRTRIKGSEPDWDLRGLKAVYAEVHTMNRAFFERLKTAARTDSSLNALVHLDMFALMLPLQVEMELPAVMGFFRPFLEQFPNVLPR